MRIAISWPDRGVPIEVGRVKQVRRPVVYQLFRREAETIMVHIGEWKGFTAGDQTGEAMEAKSSRIDKNDVKKQPQFVVNKHACS